MSKMYRNDKGQLHREDGPAFEGTEYKAWYLNGLRHREDGPATEYPNGEKYWYLNDKLHRVDGPAIEFSDGTKEWFYYDEQIHCSSNEEFLRIIKLKAFW